MTENAAATLALRPESLAELADRGLPGPTYDRERLVPRIAHIGVGGFHRAHLAIYVHNLAQAGSGWAIRGIGLLPGDQAMADALGSQSGLYTFTAKATGERNSEIIGSIIDYVFAADDPELAVAAIADPEIAIVSMTVTEAGYTDEPQNRRTFDVIAQGLDRRRRDGAGPVTLLSCDNLPGNGDALRRRIADAAARVGGTLGDWITDNCSFPNSMVDRITPQTADADRDYLVETYGLADAWPVVGEPFWQWVLEDDFAAGRPDFASVGALYSDDVEAWEYYKLRMLNAGHSCIAYLAALAGIGFVDEAMAEPAITNYLRRFYTDEAIPPLKQIPGHPAADYAEAVIERFANTGVRDQIARLCIDGTAKFPTFLMPTIAYQLQSGGEIAASALALAAWCRYLGTTSDDKRAPDALGSTTLPLAERAKDDPASFLVGNPAFPDEVSTNDRFTGAFESAYRDIVAHGSLGAIEQLLN